MKAVTHLEKVIAGEVSAVTHLEKVIAQEATAVTYTEKVIAGTVPPITHLQKVIAGVVKPVTHLEYVWAGGSPPSVQEYTGAVPVTITADGTPLLDYLIIGNEEHSGTPTPTTPIQPSGCGDLETTGVHAGQYKIPISSANTTTPVYLGEVQTTRKIKKLVLTGKKSWQLWNGNYYSSVIDRKGAINTIVCSHFINSTSNGISYNRNGSSGLRIAAAVVPFVTSVSELTTYLAAQYAAGTPVTVWYVLANEETAVVNEPLMRIGDYSDTLSMEQAGAQIPTANGSTTLDVETTVKPYEIYIKYRGEAVATLSTLSAEVSSPETTTEEENLEETEEEENGSEDVSL